MARKNVDTTITEAIAAEWGTPEATEQILSLLGKGEKNPDGFPNVKGLRRIAPKILGKIKFSAPTNIQTNVIKYNGIETVHVAVIHQIQYRDKDGDLICVGDSGDVYYDNCDPEFARYGCTATTRAEARCYKKALGLTVVTADEITDRKSIITEGIPPAGEEGGFIKSHQITHIQKMCRDLKMDVMKFVNSGKNTYKDMSYVPYDTAVLMMEKLNKFLQDPASIPDSFKLEN